MRRRLPKVRGWSVKCAVCDREFLAVSTKQNVCSSHCRFLMYRGSGDGCHEWTGPTNTSGYGVLFLNANRSNGRRMVVSAHRYAYEHFIGAIPNGMCVMHRCDNPKCTNPSHLSIGTQADNNRDRSLKGRSGSREFTAAERAAYSEKNRGSKNSLSKLTEEIAAKIKYDRSTTNKQAADLYGISRAVVSHIRTNRSWRHV